MSAFMVADETINRVVTWLAWEVYRNMWLKDKVAKFIAIDLTKGDWEAELGNAMFQLNIDAVNARYGQGEAQHFRKLDYQYRIVSAPKLQVYKSMRCWLYQCCEGDVFKRPLYQAFDTVIIDYLMRQIIADLPEYEKAAWE
jgi:hypothetical protein